MSLPKPASIPAILKPQPNDDASITKLQKPKPRISEISTTRFHRVWQRFDLNEGRMTKRMQGKKER